MEAESKKCYIRDQEFLYRSNFRAGIEYERICGEAVGVTVNLERNLLYLYTGIIAGMKKAKKEFTMTFEEFIDFIDDDFDVLNRMVDETQAEQSKKEIPLRKDSA